VNTLPPRETKTIIDNSLLHLETITDSCSRPLNIPHMQDVRRGGCLWSDIILMLPPHEIKAIDGLLLLRMETVTARRRPLSTRTVVVRRGPLDKIVDSMKTVIVSSPHAVHHDIVAIINSTVCCTIQVHHD